MEDFNPKTITPLHFYCQHVLPLVYDESLSYYETLCKIQYKLNEVINAQNYLQEAFEQMLEWVNTQLKDYAEEILNDMLDKGQLLVELNYIAETKTLNMIFSKVVE
jgi:hypothetical protein